MKSTFLFICLALLSFHQLFAQQKAITDTGEEVILHNDGTWEYINKEMPEPTAIKTNNKKFKKPKDSNFLLKSTVFDIGFWLNTTDWKFSKATDNTDAEYELQLKKGDLYGMIITEKMEIPLETLRDIAVQNARNEAPDVKVTQEEYRIVNDEKVLMLRMDGTMMGIKFSYYGYYYSNENGTVQFITYTSQNLIDKFIEDIENLLNGFVVL